MMTVLPKRRLLEVEEYQRMFEAGILTETDRVELINGEILEISPIGNRPAAVVDRISNLLAHLLYGKAIVRVQSPIIAGQRSEPQPDLAILRWRADYYQSRHPGPEDILLVIEVADSSLEYDRQLKLPLYAAAGINRYWIVDLIEHCVEAYTVPDGERYSHKTVCGERDRLVIPEVRLEVMVGALLGS